MSSNKFEGMAEADSVPDIDTLLGQRAGDKPVFIENMPADRLVSCIMRLGMEISVIRDRMDIYESVLEELVPDLQQHLSEFESSELIEERRGERRAALIKNLLRDLQQRS